ncbi:MAG: CvpA family protein, partial [Chitinispirillaceae bacterium]|nr:CvpA family protein [Chitinispirillaceae bacterium]
MHILDVVVSVIVIFLVIAGIKRGLIFEVVRLVAIIGGATVAFIYFQEISKASLFGFLPRYVKEILSFLAIYILTAGIILLLGWFIKKLFHFV